MSAQSHYTIWSGEIELAAPALPPELPATSGGARFDAARLLVRLLGEPMGFVDVPAWHGRLDLDEVLDVVASVLGDRIRAEVAVRGAPELAVAQLSEFSWEMPTERMPNRSRTIAISTRDRPSLLERALMSVLRADREASRVIVVDNAPSSESTRQLVSKVALDDHRVDYVLEPLPGLSRARNVALRLAETEVISYVDDDVIVDGKWSEGVRRGFARQANVGCVTGLIASASLELPTEQYFDGRVWWSSSCEHRIYEYERSPRDPPLHPYNPGSIGAGANISFLTAALRSIGGFDEALGVGTPTAGGEDLDAFVRILRSGWAISYEPSALVWHAHRVDELALRRQLRGYGSGLTAYLFKHLLSAESRPDLVARGLAGLRHGVALGVRSRNSQADAGLPPSVASAELGGLALGPWLYLRSRRVARSRASLPPAARPSGGTD